MFEVTKARLAGIRQAYQKDGNQSVIKRLNANEKGTLEWLIQGLRTNLSAGISSDSIKIRGDQYGTNEDKSKRTVTFVGQFRDALGDYTLRILLALILISMCFSEYYQNMGVLVAITIYATLVAIKSYLKEKQGIGARQPERKVVKVLRDGESVQMDVGLLLVGDIVLIREGMEVPCDGVLVQSDENVQVNEGPVTGQIAPLYKYPLDICLKAVSSFSPFILAGSQVLSGQGKIIIISVGNKLMEKQIYLQDTTPLQLSILKLSNNIGQYGILSVLVILIILIIKYIFLKLTVSSSWIWAQDINKILGFFITGVTVVFVSIPEGLSLSATFSIAHSIKSMLMDNILVRKFKACEILGRVDCICTDKTGILTNNKIAVNQVWNGSLINVKPQTGQLADQKNFKEMLKVGSIVNSSADLGPQGAGSPTEKALLEFYANIGIDYESQRKKYNIKMKSPFNSSKKTMSIITQIQGQDYLFVKGASQVVLRSCSNWINRKNEYKVEELTQQVKESIEEAMASMAIQTQRTISLAYKKISKEDDINAKTENGQLQVQKGGLVFIALVGMRDNPRKQIPRRVKECQTAGIDVKMITGDNMLISKYIAKQVGIWRGEHDVALEGSQFSDLIGAILCSHCRKQNCECSRSAGQSIQNIQKFQQIADNLSILARSKPEDKYKFVNGLQQLGKVVAVVGDSISDLPALVKADIGISLAISGSQQSRQVSSIILLDDNFNSIIRAVLWGRNVYNSIRKIVQYQLTVIVVTVTLMFVRSVWLDREFLTPVQMIWISIFMDSLASLALSNDGPDESMLTSMPQKEDAQLVTKQTRTNIAVQSIYQIIVLVGLIFYGEKIIPEYSDSLDSSTYSGGNQRFKWFMQGQTKYGTVCSGRFYTAFGQPQYVSAFRQTNNYSRHFTFVFNTFVMLQLFNLINCRRLSNTKVFKRVFSNKIFWSIFVGILLVQTLIINLGGKIFSLYPQGLTKQQWLFSILIGSTSLLIRYISAIGGDSDEKKLSQNVRKHKQL